MHIFTHAHSGRSRFSKSILNSWMVKPCIHVCAYVCHTHTHRHTHTHTHTHTQVKLAPEFGKIPHEKGVISMKRFYNPDSAGSQFIISMSGVCVCVCECVCVCVCVYCVRVCLHVAVLA